MVPGHFFHHYLLCSVDCCHQIANLVEHTTSQRFKGSRLGYFSHPVTVGATTTPWGKNLWSWSSRQRSFRGKKYDGQTGFTDKNKDTPSMSFIQTSLIYLEVLKNLHIFSQNYYSGIFQIVGIIWFWILRLVWTHSH